MLEWNTIKYIDCLNSERGLSNLPDKSIDLALTDPPWGSNYASKREGEINYKDKWRPEWNLKWFNELIRICNGVILIIPESKLIWWIRNTKEVPLGIFIIDKGGGFYPSKISKFCRFSPMIIYGKLRNKMFANLRKLKRSYEELRDFIHPSPKDSKILKIILNEIKPKNVIDPFMGSGAVAEACESLQIPWYGYEINEKYKHDIDLRLKKCKIEPKIRQLQLFDENGVVIKHERL